MNLIVKILTPFVGKIFDVLFGYIYTWIEDWLEERRQDRIDREIKEKVKNPKRPEVARDLDESFE